MKRLFILFSLFVSVTGFSQALDTTMNFCFGKEQVFGQSDDRSRPRIFDFDKDGDKDFAILEFWYDSLAVYLNNGSADFTTVQPIRISIPSSQVDLTAGDFDGDSYIDIITISDVGDLNFFKNNVGTGFVGMGSLVNTTLPNLSIGKIETYDFNNDGLLDIIGTGYDLITNDFYAYTFQQSVTFSFFNLNPLPIFSPHKVQFNLPEAKFAVADFNNDGFKDFVVGSTDMSDTIEVYKNAGTTAAIAFFPTPTTFTNPVGGYCRYFTAKDYNGDGLPDIAVSSSGGFSLNKNTGTMAFSPLISDPSFYGDQFAITDLNSNNKMELMGGNYGQYNIYPGTSSVTPNFSGVTSDFYVGDTRNFELADFDGNSTPDILFTRGQDFPYMYISRNFSFYVQEHITSTNTVVCGATPVTFSVSNTYSAYPGNYDWTPGPASGINYTAPSFGGNVSCAFSFTLPPGLGQCVLYTDTILINSLPVPSATFSQSVSGLICAGTTVSLTASILPSIVSYTWSTGASTPAIVVTPTATTTYSLFMDNGCKSTGIYTLTIMPNPTVNITAPSTSLCVGDSLVLTANGANIYTWTPSGANSTTFTVKPTATSAYTLVGKNSFGCSDTTSTTITVNTLPILSVVPSKSLVCFPDTMTLSASGAPSYTWNTGANSSALTLTVLANSVYTVVGSNGCKATSIFTVTGSARPIITATSSKPTVCNGDSVTLNAYGASTYTWAPSLFIGNSYYTYPSASTTYSVFGMAPSGCYNYTTVSIGLNNPPVLDMIATELCVGKSATISAIGANTYTWNTGSVSQAIIQIPVNNTALSFTIDGVDATGCKSTFSKTFSISDQCNLIVWNGVTPNGDGQNDFFFLENIEQYPGNTVTIFNRWGQKLAEISNYNNTNNYWSGSDEQTNADVPSGTYYYVINLGNGSEKLKGWIELTKKGVN